ncbi:MAG: hypothetical protein NVV83_00325 [Afipia sp.]|nr:hypothetical protein [Afipia sp.]
MADVGIVCGTSLLMLHFVTQPGRANTASTQEER